MNVTVRDVMSSPAHRCTPLEPLNAAAKIMWDHDCGFVPVVDAGERVVGVITDRDICMAAYTQGLPLHQIPIERVMSLAVQTCRPKDPVAAAEATMRSQRIRRLPVVDNAGRLVGVLALNDIARRAVPRGSPRKDAISGEEVVETLAAICRAHGHEELVPVAEKKELQDLRPRVRLTMRPNA